MSTRRPGRPRSAAARTAILAASAQLIEKEGYGRVTMEAIARCAGVSKQTVYRWWPNKGAIVLEALAEAASVIAPAPDAGSLEEDLRIFVRRTVRGGTGRNRALLAALMAEAQRDEAFGKAFREGFLAQRRAVLHGLLDRARDRDEVADSTDCEFLAELVFAMLWYRILVGNRPLDQRFADQLTDTLLALAGPAPA